MIELIHIISLGAGVQSSTMSLMAAAGEITPMPIAAIFADTQAEPKSVYTWLDWLEKQLPFPVYRVSKGNLAEVALKVRKSKGGKLYTKSSPPAFTTDGSSLGLLMRQCTEDFKLAPIYSKLNQIRKGRKVIQWIGISLDEASRMKPARRNYCTNRWPLIEQNLTRLDCIQWMKNHNFPEPPRSACFFCPYHDDRQWIHLKTNEPSEFQRAVVWEAEFQKTMKQVTGFRGIPFLHRSLKPVNEVDFKVTTSGKKDVQTNFNFHNECEGMCGV